MLPKTHTMAILQNRYHSHLSYLFALLTEIYVGLQLVVGQEVDIGASVHQPSSVLFKPTEK